MDDTLLFDPELHSHLVSSFVDLHQACFNSTPYTIAAFLPTLDDTPLLRWWEERFKEAGDGQRKIIMQVSPSSTTEEPELVGYVMLQMPVTETRAFRGVVEKLRVSPEHRRKGIATKLMERWEEVATEEKRTLLVIWFQI